MENSYIDLLLVERVDGAAALVVAEAHSVYVGSLIEFDGGKVGRVIMRAWGGERNGEVHNLIAAIIPTYEAEVAYSRSWEKQSETEDGNGEIPGSF